MTERDLIKQVVEKSITKTADIEILRKWAKSEYEEASKLAKTEVNVYYAGVADAYFEMIQELDSLETL